MSADDCIFCKIATGRLPATKIYEDQVAIAFLDIGPVSDGHTLVIPKQHFEKLHDCPNDLLGQVTKCIGKVAKAVAAAMNSEGYNVLCNNGRAAGQIVNHLHFHIIPRNTDDAVFDRWPAYQYQAGMIETIAARIREKL